MCRPSSCWPRCCFVPISPSGSCRRAARHFGWNSVRRPGCPSPAHHLHHHDSQHHADLQNCPFGSAPAQGPRFRPPGFRSSRTNTLPRGLRLRTRAAGDCDRYGRTSLADLPLSPRFLLSDEVRVEAMNSTACASSHLDFLGRVSCQLPAGAFDGPVCALLASCCVASAMLFLAILIRPTAVHAADVGSVRGVVHDAQHLPIVQAASHAQVCNLRVVADRDDGFQGRVRLHFGPDRRLCLDRQSGRFRDEVADRHRHLGLLARRPCATRQRACASRPSP